MNVNHLRFLALSLILFSPAGVVLRAQDLKAPEHITDLRLNGKKTQVLIYYSNESGETKNLNRITDWLTGAADARLQKIGERLKDDAKRFPETAAAEAEELRAAVYQSATSPFALVVFSNALAREGKYRYAIAGEQNGQWQTGTLKLPVFNSAIAAESPLVTPQGLAGALVAVAARFPAKNHTYLLISKSHGSKSDVIAPLVANTFAPSDKERVLNEMTTMLDRQTLMKGAWSAFISSRPDLFTSQSGKGKLDSDKMTMPFLDADKASTPILDADKASTPILDADKASTPILSAPETSSINFSTEASTGKAVLAPADALMLDLAGPQLLRDAIAAGIAESRPLARNYLSIPKPVYLSILRAAGEQLQMRFPLVFLESCKSEVSRPMIEWMKEKPNVGLLYTSDMAGLNYRSIDYTKLFEAMPQASAGSKLNAALTAKFEADKKARESASGKK